MAKRDYYETLGIARGATQDEIRRAYRKLARQFHPDVNKEKDAQARFTQVQEAYDVLSDEQKKKRYDQFGSAEPAAAGASRSPHYSWTNVGNGRPGAGFDQSELDPETLGSMFEAFFGGRGDEVNMGRRGRGRAAPRGRGADVEAELDVPFLRAARGGTESVRMETGGRTRTIDVTIPKGVGDGAKLRIKGAGESGTRNLSGDLILTVRVGSHPLLKRDADSLDLRIELPLTIAEATLGAGITVPTLHGQVELRIPPGTSSGQRFRLKGRGVEDEAGRQGDLYAIARIITPPAGELSPQEREQLEAISAHTPSPRPPAQWRID
jgi:DnaJ-class molecular chaperone